MVSQVNAKKMGPSTWTLASPVSVLPGVGPAIARRLAARKLTTLRDLLFFYPLDYLDDREVTPLEALATLLPLDGEQTMLPRVTVRGIIAKVATRRVRYQLRLAVGIAPARDAPICVWCTWFRAHQSLVERFRLGETIVASGSVRHYRQQLQMAHPDIHSDDEESRVAPRYPEIDGVAPRLVRRLCRLVCEHFADSLTDPLPAELLSQLSLPTLPVMLRTIHVTHAPTPDELATLRDGAHVAQQRLAFDEIFAVQLGGAWRRRQRADETAPVCKLSDEARRRISAVLPFALTEAQTRALEEILSDMSRPMPMSRLLQGDVGAGKTVVALIAALAAVECDAAAMIMAPTEILAHQHIRTLEPWCKKLGVRCELLTSTTSRQERRALVERVARGKAGILVGTHALLSDQITPRRLGVVVVDEQHRFGVLQRLRLARHDRASKLSPHLLVMSATPIPRSLALTVCGDLDLSTLDHSPPGRAGRDTRVYWKPLLHRGSEAATSIAERVRAGDQVFVVCPLIDASEKVQASDARSAHRRVKEIFPYAAVGLIHGRLSAEERETCLRDFSAGRVQILIATTVIEVGIDVPNAQVMIVEHAERFGLAQLHQLRGRVGRRERRGLCLLLTHVDQHQRSGKRLLALERCDDGFSVAEADLAHRGPGEVWGLRQAGVPLSRWAAAPQYRSLVTAAHRAAHDLFARDPDLALPSHQPLRQFLEATIQSQRIVGAEAG